MYSTSENEKEFLKQTSPPKTLKEFSELTDRELLERQTFYLFDIRNSNDRIKANLQFWFYFTIGVIVLSLLFFMKK